jgi:hypothetical protein
VVTPGEAAQIVTAFAAVGSMFVSWLNSRKLEVVHKATNGMKTELVAEVRAASLAKGNKEGRAQMKHEREHK